MFKLRNFCFVILVLSVLTGKSQGCPNIIYFSCSSSLPNPCITYKTYARVSFSGLPTLTLTYNYGDSSPNVTTTNSGSGSIFPITYHNYTTPGTYTLTLTVSGPGTCVSTATTQINVSGYCTSCNTYSILSTGFNRATNLPITTTGNFDPYWYVVKKQNLTPSPNFLPTGTPTTYTGVLAYDIDPNGSVYFRASGEAKFISLNSTNLTQDASPYMTTYRTYFNLPAVLPTSTSYSLVMVMRADDGIYQVTLNGTDIKPVGYGADGGMYGGDPLILSVNSCSTNLLLPGQNYIDISASDTYLASTQLTSEILLYECNTPCIITPTCPTISSLTHINLSSAVNCSKFEFNANISGYNGPACPSSSLTASWNYGDSSPTATTCADGGGAASAHQFSVAGTYTVTLTVTGPGTCVATATDVVTVTCTTLPCADCIPSFAPIPGKTYVVSGWVKEQGAPQSTTTYTNAKLSIISGTTTAFFASGQIIDGWQRLEGQFTIPSTSTTLDIKLDCINGNCFYDDIRVFPFDGSMKSYVYDPVNMRLVAELDERNYATLYEYDEEGKLIRVKKETEKGKMTIQENRNNTKK